MDYDKNRIRINKKKHYDKSLKRINPAKDGHEILHRTIYHELLHAKHPEATEKQVLKMEKRPLSTKKKQALLAKIQK